MTSEEVYEIECFIEFRCESYKFGPKEDGGHVCGLSDSDAIRYPFDLVTRIYLLWNPGMQNKQSPSDIFHLRLNVYNFVQHLLVQQSWNVWHTLMAADAQQFLLDKCFVSNIFPTSVGMS